MSFKCHSNEGAVGPTSVSCLLLFIQETMYLIQSNENLVHSNVLFSYFATCKCCVQCIKKSGNIGCQMLCAVCASYIIVCVNNMAFCCFLNQRNPTDELARCAHIMCLFRRVCVYFIKGCMCDTVICTTLGHEIRRTAPVTHSELTV